jgi:hypothetical protein
MDGGKVIIELESSALKFNFSQGTGSLLSLKNKPETVS